MVIKLTQSLRVISLLMFCLLFVNMAVVSATELDKSLDLTDTKTTLNPFGYKKLVYEAVTTDKIIEDNFMLKEESFDYPVVRISKTFFWITTDKVAEYKIINSYNSLINSFTVGKAVLYQDAKLFDSADFIGNMKQDYDLNYNYFIKKDVEYFKDVPVYSKTEICKDIETNETLETKTLEKQQSCYYPIESYKEESYFVNEWVKYNYETLKAGDYEWKIEATKPLNKKVDFIPVAQNIVLDEYVWWNTTWALKKEITLNTGVSSTLSDFPVTIKIDTASLISAGTLQADCDDLRFLASNESFELDFEIESGTCNKSDTVVFVKVPSLATGNQTIYMYYDSASATDGQDAVSVWSDYEWVYHFANTYDSAGNHNLTAVGFTPNFVDGDMGKIFTLTSGEIGTNAGYFSIGGSTLELQKNFTTSYRVLATSFNNDGEWVLMEQANNVGCTQIQWREETNSEGQFYITSQATSTNLGGATLSLNTWYNLVSQHDNSDTNIRHSKDGTADINTNGQAGTQDYASSLFGTTRTGCAYGGKATGNFTEMRMRNLYSSDDWVSAEFDTLYYFGAEVSNNKLTITSTSPIDNYNSTSQNIDFECDATDETGVYSLNLTINGTVYETVTGAGTTNLTLSSTETLADGYWEWYCTGNDADTSLNSTTRSLLIDSTSPVISNATGLDNIITLTLPTNSTWNYTANDVHLDSCYYNTTDNATYNVITCNSTQNTTWATQGIKTIQFCANDTFGFETCDTQSIYVYYIQEDQGNNPETVAEGFEATFNLTVNLTNIPTTTATLIINNTIYSPDTTTAGTNGYFFEKTIEIPDTWGNTTGIIQDWYWNYTINGVITNESPDTDNITVYELAIDDCSSYGEVILDFNLNDEETATAVNESAGANVEIDLQITSKQDASVYFTYNKTWTDENNPKVCIPANVLNNSDYWIDFTVGFSSTDHVWEFYYLDDGTLNSTKVFNSLTDYTIDLMDLLTDDSTSFLFNYFDQDGLPVDDAIVHVFRKYIGEGTFREVERAKADQNGDTIVHLVEEDVIYYFSISQYGEILFTSSIYTALCQATPCQIQIEASGSGASFPTDWDLVDGGAYSISSIASTRQVNLTYALNETSIMNLTVYKYNSDGSYSPLNTSTSTGSSGSIIMTVPQSAGNVSFFATVVKDDQFINSEWVDFTGKASDRFGITTALFISALIILCLGLISITEGVGTLVFVILGVALSGFLGLITTTLSTGVNIVVYLVVAGGILLWKLTSSRR